MDKSVKPLLAITMGDPAGIGAEVIVKTLADSGVYEFARPFVVGNLACLESARKQAGLTLTIKLCPDLSYIDDSNVLQVLETAQFDQASLVMGQVDVDCGRAAVQFFESAVQMALQDEIRAVVTCPINKAAVHAAGYFGDIGHQEILARMTNATLTATMLMTTGLKVAHLSTHKSLAEAVQFVTCDALVERLVLTAEHLRRWSGSNPRIAVAALNPHGGEAGMLGREEIEEIAPAIRKVRSMGIDAVGPYPADSIFYRAVGGEFDAVMALYHDQGHIAIKMHNFEDSITATMGIPFIRTSVDHGTAFDIAGKNLANAKGLKMALDAAIDMLEGRLQV
ncbi:MAG: 4-hydroxythreonine-4-phosphate dehydrogenase PdxA [Pseudomonadales bacterium]|nr:4-hydroxythreonine-4-phosphate dehydrogenase PdxA [Pseudomonadales bacterium]